MVQCCKTFYSGNLLTFYDNYYSHIVLSHRMRIISLSGSKLPWRKVGSGGICLGMSYLVLYKVKQNE